MVFAQNKNNEPRELTSVISAAATAIDSRGEHNKAAVEFFPTEDSRVHGERYQAPAQASPQRQRASSDAQALGKGSESAALDVHSGDHGVMHFPPRLIGESSER
ncbi:hypothetical protein AXG93_3271s1380 [Marchantia polymorpha subsp. ruderalis]|uniref:Uncharacterized protein n=1 Tax=Marchantia polymorpha subsp. ruderalis TaxID=1480154 RepID=A0A176VQF3_MARPO|nr:hypothetical protein AXG93_3271s1380 [Marchantia polymorpha subsp. ruderalis]